jgi:uracil-DNA glycosylase
MNFDVIKSKFSPDWWLKLEPFFVNGGFDNIAQTLNYQKNQGFEVTPKFDDVFRAFKECPYGKLKVVIMGQDPYYQAIKDNYGRLINYVADGLAFSGRYQPLDCPASLKLMINAIEREVYDGFAIPFNEEYTNPDLTRWAKQGVLLINCALTTLVGKTEQHMNLWAPFLRYVFNTLRNDNSGIIYILLGKHAKQWKVLINPVRNHILTASHPASALHSERNVWDSEGVFLNANKFLEQMNGPESKIIW